MNVNANEFKNRLVKFLSSDERILGIGQTGDMNAPLVPGKSDIDMFVLCSEVPQKAEREEMYRKLCSEYESLQVEVCSGGIWGYGDIFMCGGIDVMPMYFTVEEMQGYLKEVLDGKHLEKEGRFYPVGRLASIESINILFEKDEAWSKIVALVKSHPASLFKSWCESECWKMIDEEDLGRAELRHEVLFYHQVVEEFLDHFLQVLYAKNNRYFPSRKRTEKAIAEFEKKPENCYRQLLKIVELAAKEETIEESVAELRKLGDELKEM